MTAPRAVTLLMYSSSFSTCVCSAVIRYVIKDEEQLQDDCPHMHEKLPAIFAFVVSLPCGTLTYTPTVHGQPTGLGGRSKADAVGVQAADDYLLPVPDDMLCFCVVHLFGPPTLHMVHGFGGKDHSCSVHLDHLRQ